MKSHRPANTSIIVLCLGVLFCAGCANFLQPETGAVARPEARIALSEKGVQKQTFTAGDVKIIYSLAGAGEPFALSGTIVFDQSLTYSFPIIVKFLLKMSFLDGESRVIETIDITPVFGSFGRVSEKLDFRVSRVAPPGSKAIAFNYFGEFRSNPPETSGTWEIFYFPFD
ncbi:MAG TPA: hypothetical protein DDY32_06405 [Desulfobulbaceae bacterium]|nr:hypothetical protein [Desulfobulbaceae bacterium]